MKNGDIYIDRAGDLVIYIDGQNRAFSAYEDGEHDKDHHFALFKMDRGNKKHRMKYNCIPGRETLMMNTGFNILDILEDPKLVKAIKTNMEIK